MLERTAFSSVYDFVEGVPSQLNRMLWAGKIDISPSSSIEYLRHQESYVLLEGHSISSRGPIGSILLFSRRPLESLRGATILVTRQSETSIALLRIIMKRFYGIECTLKPSDMNLSEGLKSHPAALLIGDDALIESHRAQEGLHLHDLAGIWHEHTGLPFVFALWIARRDRCEEMPHLFDRFTKDLDAAKHEALQNLEEIAEKAPLCGTLSREEIIDYWKGISYDLTEEHRKGLELFRQYARELDLMEQEHLRERP